MQLSQILLEYHVADIGHLKSYLNMTDEQKAEDAAFKFSVFVDDWAEEVGVELGSHDDSLDAIENMSTKQRQEFGQWVLDDRLDYIYRHYPETDWPAWMTMSYLGDVRNQWLIHFTDHPGSIEKRGFDNLISDMQELAYTTSFKKEYFGRSREGYGFAYLLNDYMRYGRSDDRRGGFKYGNEAVLFRASGIRISHAGDREPQVIFYGPTATNINGVFEHEDGFSILNKKTMRPLITGDMEKVVDWFVFHYEQYRKVLY